jgi:glucokinase
MQMSRGGSAAKDKGAMSQSYYLGADLGGTSLRLGAVSATGELVGDVLSTATGRGYGPEQLQADVKSLAHRVRRQHPEASWHGVGLGTAGVIHDNGPLSHADNLPKLVGAHLRALLEEALGCPVIVENDARCFTLAETRFGAARGARTVCGITLGTGLGSGLLVNGKLIRGIGSQAGEVCRIPLRGHHLEHFVSTEGLVRVFGESGGSTAGMDGQKLAEAARGGSKPALAAWRSYGEDLATLCEFVVAIVEPEVIVIGGSLAQAHDLFGAALEHRLAERRTRVVYAELGPKAGVIGAAVLAMPRERSRAYRRSSRTQIAGEALPVEALKLKSEGAL